MATTSYTPDYTKDYTNTTPTTVQDFLNLGYDFKAAMAAMSPSAQQYANYGADGATFQGRGPLAYLKYAMGVTPNRTGTPQPITQQDILNMGFNQQVAYSALNSPIDTSRPYSFDANGNPVYNDPSQNRPATQPSISSPQGQANINALNNNAGPLDPNAPSGHSAAYLAANPQFNATAAQLQAIQPTGTPTSTDPANTPAIPISLGGGSMGTANPNSQQKAYNPPDNNSGVMTQNTGSQLGALNAGATPTTNNGVGNSTSGSQMLPGQVGASFGNISQQTPQDAQRSILNTDPNNITGYQTGIKNSSS